jgi:hypothetical protein
MAGCPQRIKEDKRHNGERGGLNKIRITGLDKQYSLARLIRIGIKI